MRADKLCSLRSGTAGTRFFPHFQGDPFHYFADAFP